MLLVKLAGSALSLVVCLVLPASSYLVLHWRIIAVWERAFNVFIVLLGAWLWLLLLCVVKLSC